MPRATRTIYDEEPRTKMWDTYLYLESEPTVLQLLTMCYEKRKEKEPQRLAFQNTIPFIYYLKQGREYFQSAQSASLMVKPLVMYYGMVSLTKAYILTLDPHYPDRTSLLRHGLSTRKRKKIDYCFQEDEVKVQKQGLLPHVLRLLNLPQGLEEKYKLWECLGNLPQLYHVFRQVNARQMLYPVSISRGRSETVVRVEEGVLDHFHLGREGLVQKLNDHHLPGAKGHFSLRSNRHKDSCITMTWHHPHLSHVSLSGDGFQNAMLVADASGQFFLRLTTEARLHLPEFIYYLMLLFHLSMLARYETERWGEIVWTFGSEERFLIHELLQQTERYYPNLLLNEMLDEKIIFKQP